jgi:primosomal replication protein N
MVKETTNHLSLNARLMSKKALRYTPAGVPVLELSLAHTSEQSLEGVSRKLSFECPAVAFGEMALSLQKIGEEVSAVFEGYLAPQYGTHSRWVMHIHRFNLDC